MNKALETLHMKTNGSDESELTCSEGLQGRRRSSGRKLSIVDAGKELIRKGSKKKIRNYPKLKKTNISSGVSAIYYIISHCRNCAFFLLLFTANQAKFKQYFTKYSKTKGRNLSALALLKCIELGFKAASRPSSF